MICRWIPFIILTGILYISGSCTLYEEDAPESEYFVYSQLTALDPLPQIQISNTIQFESESMRDKQGVSGSDVRLHLLDSRGTRKETYTYTETSKGRYRNRTDDTVRIQPRRTYELEIKAPDAGEALTSTTTVPDTFSLKNTVRDSVVYLQPDQLEYQITSSFNSNQKGSYIFTTIALDADNNKLVPYYESSSMNRVGLRNFRSKVIQGATFEKQNDLLNIRYPWESISHYGPQEIQIHAIDENMKEFYTTLDEQTGNEYLPPGEIRNIIYNVDGGIGLFGSKATVKAYGYVEEE